MLALIAERASGVSFHELVLRRVCEPAGMSDTEFRRSDELPGSAAIGYLTNDGGSQTNVFQLPVRGSGDGGIYSTAADIRSLWTHRFWVHPAVQGAGARPFQGGETVRLQLLDSKTFDSGVMLLRYEPAAGR